MKKTLILLAVIIGFAFSGDNHSVAWKSTNYMVINDAGYKNYKATAYVVYNSGACAFYSKQTGFKTFTIEERARTVVDGKAKVSYVSSDNEWMMEVMPPDQVEIIKTHDNPYTIVLKDLKLYEKGMDEFISTYSK